MVYANPRGYFMRVASNNGFARAMFGVYPSDRSAMGFRPSSVYFAAKDRFDKNIKGDSPAGKTQDWLVRIDELESQMQQLKDDFFKKAQALMLERLALEQKNLGPDDIEVAYTFQDLGNASMKHGQGNSDRDDQEAAAKNYDEALAYYADALKICRKKPGPEADRLTVGILESRGEIYLEMGAPMRAEAELARALQMALNLGKGKDENDEALLNAILLSLACVLMTDEQNPRNEELDLLKADPQAWLDSRTISRTLH
ncbi:MAG TPA: tetratricopeptide repeat protein [Coleofasciculaceae cyanobacterium]